MIRPATWILVIMVVGAGVVLAEKSPKHQNSGLEDLADKVIRTCSSHNYRPTCYEEEVPRLMDAIPISMEEAFAVTRLIQDRDKSYAYCHVLGHNLSAKETAKDPERWKEVVARSPGGMCSNGGVHGAFQERFRTESLTDEQIEIFKPDFKDVCEPKPNWTPTKLQQATCYHALGHLLMYITEADIHKSTSLCAEITANYAKLCYDGAFMQIFQPLEPEDFALIEGKVPKKEDMASFCSDFEERKLASCWTESWPLHRSEIKAPEGAVEFCTAFLKNINDQTYCYRALFYVITAQTQFDLVKMKTYCSELPGNVDGLCYANVASRLIETDFRNIKLSVDFCSGIDKEAAKRSCFEELLTFSTYNFIPGSKEFFELCNTMPDTWKQSCLRRI
jgi:hypothetical protein